MSVSAWAFHRRDFLGVLGSLGSHSHRSSAKAAAKPHRIDIHHYLFPPSYSSAIGAEVIEGLTAHRSAAKDLRAIERDNALRLMPGLNRSLAVAAQ